MKETVRLKITYHCASTGQIAVTEAVAMSRNACGQSNMVNHSDLAEPGGVRLRNPMSELLTDCVPQQVESWYCTVIGLITTLLQWPFMDVTCTRETKERNPASPIHLTARFLCRIR
jgi:hypothetical protein